jgi:hypothetical protein
MPDNITSVTMGGLGILRGTAASENDDEASILECAKDHDRNVQPLDRASGQKFIDSLNAEDPDEEEKARKRAVF